MNFKVEQLAVGFNISSDKSVFGGEYIERIALVEGQKFTYPSPLFFPFRPLAMGAHMNVSTWKARV